MVDAVGARVVWLSAATTGPEMVSGACVAPVRALQRARRCVCHGDLFARVLVLAPAELFLCVRACAGGRWSECSSRMAQDSYGGAADGLRCVCVADVGDGERSQVRRGAVSARVLVLALAELFLCVRACAGGRWC